MLKKDIKLCHSQIKRHTSDIALRILMSLALFEHCVLGRETGTTLKGLHIGLKCPEPASP